jgi:single-stranded DNA-binding protein
MEIIAESLEGAMVCFVEGRLAYRKAIGKNGQEKASLMVVSWYVTIATPTLSRPVESQN